MSKTVFYNTQVGNEVKGNFVREFESEQAFGHTIWQDNYKYDKWIWTISGHLIELCPIKVKAIIDDLITKFKHQIDLSSLKLFESLDQNLIQKLESICSIVNWRYNQAIINEGAKFKNIFIIKEGEFEINKKVYSNQNQENNNTIQSQSMNKASANWNQGSLGVSFICNYTRLEY